MLKVQRIKQIKRQAEGMMMSSAGAPIATRNKEKAKHTTTIFTQSEVFGLPGVLVAVGRQGVLAVFSIATLPYL